MILVMMNNELILILFDIPGQRMGGGTIPRRLGTNHIILELQLSGLVKFNLKVNLQEHDLLLNLSWDTFLPYKIALSMQLPLEEAR